MIHEKAPERFANKCAEATIGYAHAGFFAGLYAAHAVMENWCVACEKISSTPRTASKSWFRHPDHASLESPFSWFANPTTFWSELWTPHSAITQSTFVPWLRSTPMTPLTWTDFWPTPPVAMQSFGPFEFPVASAVAVWPMTWSIMSMGVPQEIAKPTAEANVAAYDALESAQQIATDSVAAYSTAFQVTDRTSKPPQSSADPDDPFALFRPWF